MKTNLLLFAILLLPLKSLLAQPAATPELSLQECLKKAIDHSAVLQINALEQSKLNYARKETVGQGLPGVNLAGSYDDYLNLPTSLIPGEFFGYPGQMIPVQFGTNFNIAGSLDFNQLIYNQSYLVALRMSKLMLEQNSLSGERMKNELVFNVAQSYYYIQISRNQIRNLESNLAQLEKAEQIARSQFANGLIMKIDVDRISVNKLNVQTQIERLKVNYEQQLNLQRYFMGLDLTAPVAFPDTIQPVPADLLAFANPENHIDIRMIEKQKQLATTGIKLDQSAYYPSLMLIGSVNYTNQSNTFYMTGDPNSWFNTTLVGIRVKVPIFNGLQHHNKVNQSKINLEQLKVSENDTRKMLSVGLKDASGKLQNAIADELRQRENMKVAQRVFDISQEQYRKGMIPLTDLLNAETGLRDAQTNHSLALVQMKIAELEYRKANGTLLEIL